MLRYIRYLFLATVALALILMSLANREWVTLHLLPEELAQVIGLSLSVSLPLFAVILIGVLIGLLIGFVWEYLRELKMRVELGRKDRELHRLERKVKVLKEKTGEGQDDVLALID